MILGLSHIAINSTDLEASTQSLTGFGYKLQFEEKNLRNDVSKKPFLNHYASTHDISMFKKNGAISIEILMHGGQVTRPNSNLIPIFRSNKISDNWLEKNVSDLPIAPNSIKKLEKSLKRKFLIFFDPLLGMHIFWTLLQPGEVTGLFLIILLTSNYNNLADLMSSLRFEKSSIDIWSLLTPIPTLSAHIMLLPRIHHKDWNVRPMLDGSGCTCLAFMVRNLSQTDRWVCTMLSQIGSFKLNVDGQKLLIALFSGVNLPFFELIEYDKNN